MHAVLGTIENYNSQRRISFALVSFKAGTAVTAGTVLAILLFSHLTIRVGGHVAMLIVVPVHACSSKRPAAHVSLSRNFL